MIGSKYNSHIRTTTNSIEAYQDAKEKMHSFSKPRAWIVRELRVPSVQYCCFLFKKITEIKFQRLQIFYYIIYQLFERCS